MNNRLIAIASLLACSAVAAGPSTPVLPPGAKANGRTPEQLSAAWWQWAKASPAEINPVHDSSGRNCHVDQEGDVWFLAGGFGSSKIIRTCTIPVGKHVFFPVVNMVYWAPRGNGGLTCEGALRAAAVNNEKALELFVEVDGKAVEDVKRYRVSTKECFDIYQRVPAEFAAYNAYPSASDGYWILLAPLAKGKHTLKFGGRYHTRGSAYGHMVQDIQYEILVK